jgi:hypothetical protein
MSEPYFNSIEGKVVACSFRPFDGDDGPSIEILLEAQMGQGLSRFKSVEVGMCQTKTALIDMDQDKRRTADFARCCSQSCSDSSDQGCFSRSDFPVQGQHLSALQARSYHVAETFRVSGRA